MFLVPALGYGGAERQLVALARGLHERGHRVRVTTFYSGGPLENELHDAGVPVLSVHKRHRWDVVRQLVQIIRIARREAPLILHGYTSEPNILAVLLKPLLPGTVTVLGVRNSDMQLARYEPLTRFTFRLERMLARFADLAIVNSNAGRDYAARSGFPTDRLAVIPNGIDLDRFRSDPRARPRVRAEWGVAAAEVLVGMVGRLDPMKDHETLVRAAAITLPTHPELRFVCVGDGSVDERARIGRLGDEVGVGGRLTLVAGRDDMHAVYSAFDVLVSSSAFGEGFPNVVAEAMACSVPCVVTDVGDSADIVGDTGEVVPPRDPAALAGGLERLLPHAAEAGARARKRVAARFGVNLLIERAEAVLAGAAVGQVPRRASRSGERWPE
ncbi:MAG: glycosyltransferase [Deltaproteobacteria bacterium]|nr:glycosyltransferase [Deltaproteobacteria bacterium]